MLVVWHVSECNSMCLAPIVSCPQSTRYIKDRAFTWTTLNFRMKSVPVTILRRTKCVQFSMSHWIWPSLGTRHQGSNVNCHFLANQLCSFLLISRRSSKYNPIFKDLPDRTKDDQDDARTRIPPIAGTLVANLDHSSYCNIVDLMGCIFVIHGDPRPRPAQFNFSVGSIAMVSNYTPTFWSQEPRRLW